MIRKRTQEEMEAFVEGFTSCYNRLALYFAERKNRIEIMAGMEAAIQMMNSRVCDREGEQTTREGVQMTNTMTNEEAAHVLESSDHFWGRTTDEEQMALNVAIESLREKMRNAKDTISRQAAIDAICGTCADDGEHYKDCWIYKMGKCCDISVIEEIQPEEPQAKCIAEIKIDTEDLVERVKERYYIWEWIPTSEHLPELKDGGASDMVLLCWSDGQITVGAYKGNRTFIGQAWPEAKDARVTVVAWQPLPEPYKEEDTE